MHISVIALELVESHWHSWVAVVFLGIVAGGMTCLWHKRSLFLLI